MPRSFGLVDEKVAEAEFFFSQIVLARPGIPEARWYFSAFVSAARSVTFVLQCAMSGIDEFPSWYEKQQTKLRENPIAKFFVHIRNQIQKDGVNPLNIIPIETFQENFEMFFPRNPGHFFANPPAGFPTPPTCDAVVACRQYFIDLLTLVFECYITFASVVNSQWYFTQENFNRLGRTIEDAEEECGVPRGWMACIDEQIRWKMLRRSQPGCEIAHLFEKYLQKRVPHPDDTK